MSLVFGIIFVVGIGIVLSRIFTRFAGLAIGASLALAALLFAANCFIVVPTEKVAVERLFGRTVAGYKGPGLHIVNPLSAFWEYEALRQEFTIEGSVMASDNNTMNLETGFAIKLNPIYAYRIQESVGFDYFENLLKPAGQTAVRSAVANYTWNEASTTKRDEVQALIEKNFGAILVQQFMTSGLTREEAATAVTVFPVQIRRSLPDAKVQNAVAEKTAAQQDLARQQTLTEIAEQEALRRKNEGTGVKNLFEELPEGFTADEIAIVLSSMATKTRADALMKAVESGQVGSIIMNGDGSSAPVAIQARSGVPQRGPDVGTIGNRPGIDAPAQ